MKHDIRAALALVLALGASSCGVGDFKRLRVPTTGMEPAIAKDSTITVRIFPSGQVPTLSVGEIVVFRSPTNPNSLLFKRIVAVEGDTIEMRNRVLIRNGEPVEEPYLAHVVAGDSYEEPRVPADKHLAKLTVPPGHVYLLGDNRDSSLDSRRYGPVRTSDMVGRLIQ